MTHGELDSEGPDSIVPDCRDISARMEADGRLLLTLPVSSIASADGHLRGFHALN
jgi:hypothetical protein